MKKTLMLLAMVVALIVLPFFIDHGGSLAARMVKPKIKFRLWRRITRRGSRRSMNPPAAKLKACCLRSRAPLAQR